MSTTHTHRRAVGDFHVFEWQESDGTTCWFEFVSRWTLLLLGVDHIMRGYNWGQG